MGGGGMDVPPPSCHFWRLLDARTGHKIHQFESSASGA
jgi:hypothetical protein